MKKIKNPHAVELGRKGGKASLKTMTKSERINRAKIAVAVREAKRKALKLIGVLALFFIFSGCNQMNRILGKNHRGGGPSPEMDTLTVGVSGQSLSHWRGPADISWSHTGLVTINKDYEDISQGLYCPNERRPSSHSAAMITLGDKLASNSGKEIRMIISSIGATSSKQWKEALWQHTVEANNLYPFDVLLWTQGEGDPYTSKEEYKSNMRGIISKWRENGIKCPIYVALTQNPSILSRDVHEAQSELMAEGIVFRGPDIDAIRTLPGATQDGMHLSASGMVQQADEWFQILKNSI